MIALSVAQDRDRSLVANPPEDVAGCGAVMVGATVVSVFIGSSAGVGV
jgi:hypothetical protein